jgi:RNA polymerase sigma factor (sigma-70 family)
MATTQLPSVLRYLRKVAGAADHDDSVDGRLLERFVSARDGDAFAALVERHGPMVLGVCRRVLHDLHDAEDAFQATFLVLARRAGAIRRRAHLAQWLYGVAYRTALKARAGAARWQTPLPEVADPAADEPAAELAWRELVLVLDDEVQRLPQKYQAPLVLCYLEGRSYAEAAVQLGWPAGTVAGRLARARERLRSRLGRRGFALSAGLLGTLLAEHALAAAVPGPLVSATVKAALLTLAGQAASGVVPASVASLAEGVLKTMGLSRLKTITLLLVTLTCLGTGAGLLSWAGLAGGPAGPPTDAASPAKARDDKPPAAVKNGLSLTARLDKKAYTLNDPINLSFRLKNETDREMYVGDGFLGPAYHETGPQRHFEVHITTAAQVPLYFWSGQMTEGDTAGIRRVFRLRPGQTYEGAIRISAGFAKDKDFARRPHADRGGSLEDTITRKPHTLGKDAQRYTLVLRYQVNPETHGVWQPPTGFKEGLLWKGAIDSPPVSFTVGDPGAADKEKQGGAEARVLPLDSLYGTTRQKQIQTVTAGFNFGPDGKKQYVKPYGLYLELLQGGGRHGASNVFLVRGKDIGQAVQATWEVCARFARVDAPAVADRQAAQAPLWAVAFFGMAGSEPPEWLVKSVEVKAKTVRIRYTKGQSRTNDEHQYYLWVPLGRPGPGTFTLELFDTERNEVTLMRRVRVEGK